MTVYPQTILTGMSPDTLAPLMRNNYLEYGVDKVNNTYVFNANMIYNQNFSRGGLEVSQFYRGLGLQQNAGTFRDDENLSIKYFHPLFQNVSVVAASHFFYSADNRTRGQNELFRLNGLGGLRYDLKNTKIELTTGFEHNRQLDVNSPGFLMDLNSSLNNITFSDYNFNARLNGEFLKLNLDRINADLDFNSGLRGNFGRNNILAFNIGYRLMNRDLLSTWISNVDFIPIERRLSNNFFPGFNVGFQILPSLTGNVDMRLINMQVDKSYQKAVADIDVSKVRRRFHEFQFAVNSELRYNIPGFLQSIGLQYSSRSEYNRVFKKFNISDIALGEIKDVESMRDNISARTKLFGQTFWEPAVNDTFKLNFSTSIYRYDTPSEKNNDDRDEFNFLTGAEYMHRLNSNLSFGLFANVEMRHLVFLNSERSAMNNWNRIIRFGPRFKWHNKMFYVSPAFEIIANYTIYDFDNLTDNIRSYSFRQIGYRDSICIYLDRDVSLQAKINLRYFERGILYWDIFAESPQNSNIEYFVKALAYSKINSIISLGAGIRIYSLAQYNIANNVPKAQTFSQYSIGPETVVKINFLDQSSISLQGWYEFQYINNLTYNKIPNLFLLINVVL